MRLLEAIVDANHRALAGDERAGIRPADFADSLPIVALTCIDPRLNPLMPEVLGIPEEQFIWLRNAGNIIFDPMSSMTRTLALACAVKGGREIALIGHTDCLVRKTSTLELTERFRALGIDRNRLPENLTEFFGLFASERQNVIRGVDFVRQSPLIGPQIPVHGLLVDIQTGRLEWLVNGYEALGSVATKFAQALPPAAPATAAVGALEEFKLGEMKFPEFKIGEGAVGAPPPPAASEWVSAVEIVAPAPPAAPKKLKMEVGQPRPVDVPPKLKPPGPAPPKIPIPPPMPKPSGLKQSWKDRVKQ
jgi:carbonic anhydrase